MILKAYQWKHNRCKGKLQKNQDCKWIVYHVFRCRLIVFVIDIEILNPCNSPKYSETDGTNNNTKRNISRFKLQFKPQTLFISLFCTFNDQFPSYLNHCIPYLPRTFQFSNIFVVYTVCPISRMVQFQFDVVSKTRMGIFSIRIGHENNCEKLFNSEFKFNNSFY